MLMDSKYVRGWDYSWARVSSQPPEVVVCLGDPALKLWGVSLDEVV